MPYLSKADAVTVAAIEMDILLNAAAEISHRDLVTAMFRSDFGRSGHGMAAASSRMNCANSGQPNRRQASSAKGAELQANSLLEQARLRETILSSVTMINYAEACGLLGMIGADASAMMERKVGRRELLRFTVNGQTAYPLFQFDVNDRRVFPAPGRIIAMTPSHWSDFRLLHWLTRPHLELGGTPCDSVGRHGVATVAAFAREIEPVMHG